MRNKLSEYKLQVEGVEIPVIISGGPGLTPQYEVVLTEINPSTKAIMDNIRHELIISTQISGGEIIDPKVIQNLKDKFREKSDELLTKSIPRISEHVKKYLIALLINDMLGLGKIEFLLNDPSLQEIIINSASEPIRIYHKQYGWLLT